MPRFSLHDIFASQINKTAQDLVVSLIKLILHILISVTGVAGAAMAAWYAFLFNS